MVHTKNGVNLYNVDYEEIMQRWSHVKVPKKEL